MNELFYYLGDMNGVLRAFFARVMFASPLRW